jgi:muconate cycloisomerase
MRITRILLNEVVVPARPDSVNSPELDRPLHQLAYAGRRSFEVQFDSIPKVIIRAITDVGTIGLGEFYRGVSIDEITMSARMLLGQDVLTLNLQSLPMAEGRIYDGFECAILDLVGKCLRAPLWLLLGGCYRNQVECSYWTGHRTTADAARKANEGLERGFTCIKFKCDLNDPVVDWCQAIRETCGAKFMVVLDPNRRWQTVAATLQRSDQLYEIGNVACLEDPLPRWNLQEYRLLRSKCRVPIAVHVSLPYRELGQLPSDVICAIREGACDYFNLNGGCYAVKRLAASAELADIPFWHGSEVDLGILEASYVHKAAACANCTMPSDIFGRLVREHDLLLKPLQFDGSFVDVPIGAGLGVELDEQALAHYSQAEREVRQ